MTLRALDTLKEADVIACEDTRQTKKLLAHYAIDKPLLSFHDHSEAGRIFDLIAVLKEGKKIALVTDSGMPLISDPGFPLLRQALREGIPVEALPGPSAFVTALAASGLPAESFSFLGFLPPKSSARKKALKNLAERHETLIFYESPYRLLKTLQEMKETLGDREAVAARELTKKFEEYVRGKLSHVIAEFSKKKILGEFVILVAGRDRKSVFNDGEGADKP